MVFLNRCSVIGLLACALAVGVVSSSAEAGPEIWESNHIQFTKPSLANPMLPENQDRITDNVWITRNIVQGIFNIAQETFYSAGSPADTEWAFVFNNPGRTLTASNYQSLTFNTWVLANGSDPPATVGQPAVLHLITDDIYINIMFTSWEVGTGGNPGGGFSYIRASEIPAPGAAAGLLGLFAARTRRRKR